MTQCQVSASVLISGYAYWVVQIHCTDETEHSRSLQLILYDFGNRIRKIYASHHSSPLFLDPMISSLTKTDWHTICHKFLANVRVLYLGRRSPLKKL